MQSNNLYERLRRLVIEDPRRAKDEFLEKFDTKSDDIEDFLVRLKAPREGRLRQLVAHAVRSHTDKARILAHLFSWEATETDEFTRRAIEAALSDVDPSVYRHSVTPSASQFLDIYRYVGERLRHKMRNVMLSSQTQIVRLRKLMGAEMNTDVLTSLAKLNDSIVVLGRVLEASDVDPDYFEDRSVLLSEWLRNMNTMFSSRYLPVYLHIEGNAVDSKVLANDYLLENLFWNVWLNAHQAINSQAKITAVFTSMGEKVELLLLDNGEGFSPKLRGVAFLQQFSTNSIHRGRGLLEMQDAVQKLRGEIGLINVKDGSLRLYVRFPRQIA
jgi:hypothetical protein